MYFFHSGLGQLCFLICGIDRLYSRQGLMYISPGNPVLNQNSSVNVISS